MSRHIRSLLRFGAGVLVHAAIARGACVPVSTWDEFQSAVSKNDDLVFCSFDVSKPPAARLTIAKPKTLRCDTPRGCLLRGRGTHMVIGGPSANVSVTDFVFQGATASAVIVASSSPIRHTFRNCAFLYNTNKDGQVANNEAEGGGAIRANRNTKLRILNCDFVRNEGVDCGGAIFFLGREILVKNGTFAENSATRGGAVYKGQDSGRMKLSECKLLNNDDVNNDNSPAVYVESMDGVVVYKSVGSNNDKCDGIYVGPTGDCIPLCRLSLGS
jgi:predicted outer membrane repeat protein